MSALYRREVSPAGRVSYTPGAEEFVWDSLPKGAHLMIVEPGIKSCRYNIAPAFAAVEAALMLCESEAASAMREASEPQPDRKLTGKEAKAYAAYCKVMGHEAMLRLTTPSAMGYVKAVFDVIRKKAKV